MASDNIESATFTVVEETVVVVPDTVKFPEIVTLVGSPILILLLDTVVSISFAVPSKVRVSVPTVTVSFDPLSAAIVNSLGLAIQLSTPDPFVDNMYPFVTEAGRV